MSDTTNKPGASFDLGDTLYVVTNPEGTKWYAISADPELKAPEGQKIITFTRTKEKS